MPADNDLKAVCSVSDMANQVDLSRTRFYELMKEGVFPMPTYCVRTGRPYYPLELQQRCIEIRKTGIGHNGQLMMFYSSRRRRPTNRRNISDSKCEKLADDLSTLHLNVTPNKVKDAIEILYPGMLAKDVDEGVIVGDLFRYFALVVS